ncbi:uncharacterized protein LOC136093156 [Hydra vulgaris]|uniref:uncharacterized protein LOC136093156 n=1 Tax=Hydra vulgaris TaxID=6087 RepID=UPI0032E9DC31
MNGVLDKYIAVYSIVGPALAANLQTLSHCCNVASLSLFYKYYNGCCSIELASHVPSNEVHSFVTRHSIKSHSFTATVQHQFFGTFTASQTSVFWNSLPSSCFPDSYNFQFFQLSVICYLAL